MSAYDHIDALYGLCDTKFGKCPESFSTMPQGGGDRQYLRLRFSDGMTVIGVVDDNRGDAKAFVGLSKVFARHGVSVPEVYACSQDFTCYLEQDLGDRSLFSVLGEIDVASTGADVMKELVRMQTVDPREWSGSVCYGDFSRRQAMWDLNYFKYEFLKPAGVDFNEDLLEDDFETFAISLVETDPRLWGFMMRDCQSRNVMLSPDPVFIDYQGGRFGPCIYDAVSFVMQARTRFSAEMRQELLRVYAKAFSEARRIPSDVVLEAVCRFSLFRTLQVLGAYGFRGLVQKRVHFIESIPAALENLAALSAGGALDAYPGLSAAAGSLLSESRFSPALMREDDGRLHVKVFSFSYKRGYPEDLTGNGGGFMFDCRGMHNPGRYDRYKPLSGRDPEVAEFLKERGEADLFAARAFEMVSPSVERYIKRGFSSLQIGFGCTGGRHRSVYCAERMARNIAESFPEVVVELIHREQNIKEMFNR